MVGFARHPDGVVFRVSQRWGVQTMLSGPLPRYHPRYRGPEVAASHCRSSSFDYLHPQRQPWPTQGVNPRYGKGWGRQKGADCLQRVLHLSRSSGPAPRPVRHQAQQSDRPPQLSQESPPMPNPGPGTGGNQGYPGPRSKRGRLGHWRRRLGRRRQEAPDRLGGVREVGRAPPHREGGRPRCAPGCPVGTVRWWVLCAAGGA